MAFQVAVLLATILSAPATQAASTWGGRSTFLEADDQRMRPDMVAETLVHVEDEWRKQAADFTEGGADAAKKATAAFAKSCGSVVTAVMQGSNGDRKVAKEYMSNVCGQKVLTGWHKLRCTAFATAISDHGMLADNYANRHMNPTKVCTGFWSVFVEAEHNREAEEAKERAEQEKVRAEEEKKQAAVAAEAKTKADAEAKVEAERRAKEEARREQEEKEKQATREAAEAKVRAAEAAAHLAEKRAEAEQMQKEAQKKLEEAATAEKEHQERLAEHKKAEELVKNTAKAVPAKPAAESAKAAPAKTAKAEVVTPATPAAPKPAVEASAAKTVAEPAPQPAAVKSEVAKAAAVPQKADAAAKKK